MKTKVNMPKAALLIELGWEPINDFLSSPTDSNTVFKAGN
jgi:hypothetical protein